MTPKELSLELKQECTTREQVTALCTAIINYKIGSETDEKLEALAMRLEDAYTLRECAFHLAEELESPDKEWYKIYSIIAEFFSVTKKYKETFNELAPIYLNMEGAESFKKNRIKGLQLDEFCRSYEYDKAEAIASELVTETELPVQTAYILGDFYVKTRRYDLTRSVVEQILETEAGKTYAEKFAALLEEADAREIGKEAGGKMPYMPAKRDGKEAYVKFLSDMDIDEITLKPASSSRECISREDYPLLRPYLGAPLKNFVAFDLETTGFSDKMDSITEIGAIKVVDGKIVETAEFIFQELVRPMFGKRIPARVVEVTGITNDMVAGARTIQEVFNDFADFIGDNVLIGYNNGKFDNKMLIRAGRYSFRVITNKFVDVLPQAQLKLMLDNYKLGTVSEHLGIQNPQAHRALADAVTTAKVYLKLWEEEI